ncbi:hypothetical protein B1748_23465 [Paenibacillus sp. MY03]|uniref:hypothetical protein n=1 Tax=Paenibacillus sp. MY03 TaxID=302980 RepID=UPI000B3BFB2A|nr:hypothetical protein [Paenibacillus sp. MY03]OUS72970.1 hypothetical protein B1748_23465 [Paenibacillus sp. MY03]
MIRNKTIKFNMDKQEDRELWEYLSSLPHGTFSDLTKSFWRSQIKLDRLDEYEKNNSMVERMMEVANKYKEERK